MQDIELRHFGGRSNEVIGEGPGEKAAVLGIGKFFIKSGADCRRDRQQQSDSKQPQAIGGDGRWWRQRGFQNPEALRGFLENDLDRLGRESLYAAGETDD